ncbi:coiled-coil domain-containing protein 142 isoform X2 [Ciconia boyciana]|uniref:coiled-coil domain-containing protein 142 isoform X2 n=1 Tax=Ciconia boyciana TaxID=52775 RepID=UPI003BA064A3
MEDGGPERRGGEPCSQGEGDGSGLSGLILLLLTARPALPSPGDGAARGEAAEPGSSSLGGLARSLQKAEAALRSCVSPGLRRLLPLRPRERGCDGEDEDEDEEAPALPAALEQSFPGLRRCLCVWEDPHTETFRGRVRPQPGDSAAAFSYHPVHPRVAERGAVLHALLRHRHHLRLARDYSRRLKASSDFLRRLLVLAERPELPAGEPGAARPLRGLCQELRTHAGHWSGLRRRIRGDPWLRPLLLRGHESVARMRRALLLLALHAARLAERHAEARLRGLARAGPAAAPSPALLSDLFQGLEVYNQVVGDLALELDIAGCRGAAGDQPHAFPAARVLGILAAERGRLAAERLQPLLQPRDGGGGAEHVCWEDAAVPWPLERGTAAADVASSVREEPPGLAGELQALCREEEELMGLVLGVLVAAAAGLWHHVLRGPKQEKPEAAAESLESPELLADGPGVATAPSSPGWKSARRPDASRAPAAEALHGRYRPLFWGAAGAALGQRLGLPHRGAGGAVAAARELSRALAQGRRGPGRGAAVSRRGPPGPLGAAAGGAGPHAPSPCSPRAPGVRGGAGAALPVPALPRRPLELGARLRPRPGLGSVRHVLGGAGGGGGAGAEQDGSAPAAALPGAGLRPALPAAAARPPARPPAPRALPAPAGAGPLPGHGAGCLLLAGGQSLPVPGGLGPAPVPARRPGGPAAAEDGDGGAGGAGQRDLPGARGRLPPAAAPPRPAVPPGAPAVPADSLRGRQHPALLGGRAEDVLHQLQAGVGGDLRPDHAAGQALEGRPPRGPAQLPQRLRGGGGPGGAGPGAAGRPAPAPRRPGARPGPGDHGFPGGLDGPHPGPEDQVQPAGSLAAAAGLRAGAGAAGLGALRAGPRDPAVPALPARLPADGRGHPLPPAAARRGGRRSPPPLALPAPLLLGQRRPRAGAGRGQPARPGDPGGAGGIGAPSVRPRCRGTAAAAQRRPRVLPVGQPAAVAVAAAAPGPALARTRFAVRRQRPRGLTVRGWQ